ncbi:uncharacterized protein TRUGW13939_05507 [Talaromyces rugulosus]|uniref:FAD-binding domain-containing protein n=1 Tax=Talaromyces rugulosus TaxID=121627 RepID=A0A7H8QY49_TALRU|nr:uncharacterized protein TRUGW13939_05507 [Talaromyces rugulosus]QKX58385.1 hypothetical protein TRUGW13939_05507 [Talaromyces rugulosus]
MASSTGNGILNGLVARSSSGPGNSLQNGASLSSFSSADQARNGLVDTEFLIVGAGPAGASLACFLGSYGLKGLMISAAPGTANTPRAHITNMAAMECLRDIGLDEELEALSSKGNCMVHTRWCHSMAGEEYARIHSWGNSPSRKGDYENASPCSPVDLPQTLLEPALVRRAILKGFKTRFNTSFLSFEREAESGSIIATVRDDISNSEYQVRTKYLFGADGARSKIVKQLDLPLSVKPGQGVAINVLVRADLSHLVEHRRGNLHWVMQPDKEHPEFGWMGIVRMVKPWHEWMFILFPNRDCDHNIQPSREAYLSRVRDFIGDDTPAEILDVSKWFINEIVAEQYSQGNVFCLGDAVHRHPPMNGLGSNTCIQDAFNLAWKVAYVHHGLASPSLLDSYSIERQPVGRSIITRANQAFRDHFNVWNALGTLPEKVEDRQKVLNTLSDATPEGRKQRRAFQDAITQTSHEFHGLGVEMGQVYTGPGIYNEQEQQPYVRSGAAAKDDVLYYSPSTYPGCRVPHVWLNKAIPTAPTSTIDLTGHGEFTIFTGVGGNGWKQAAEAVATQLGVSINVHSIGFRQDWEDVYFEWENVRGVDESGAILVRPDRFVAWRSQSQPDNETCKLNLLEVMKSILGHRT